MELGAFVVAIMGKGAVKVGRYLMFWSAEVVKKRRRHFMFSASPSRDYIFDYSGIFGILVISPL